jgi:hypothetical protein
MKCTVPRGRPRLRPENPCRTFCDWSFAAAHACIALIQFAAVLDRSASEVEASQVEGESHEDVNRAKVNSQSSRLPAQGRCGLS